MYGSVRLRQSRWDDMLGIVYHFARTLPFLGSDYISVFSFGIVFYDMPLLIINIK